MKIVGLKFLKHVKWNHLSWCSESACCTFVHPITWQIIDHEISIWGFFEFKFSLKTFVENGFVCFIITLVCMLPLVNVLQEVKIPLNQQIQMSGSSAQNFAFPPKLLWLTAIIIFTGNRLVCSTFSHCSSVYWDPKVPCVFPGPLA